MRHAAVTPKAPGKLGRWLSKAFDSSQKAVTKSGSAGRKGRGKMPLRVEPGGRPRGPPGGKRC